MIRPVKELPFTLESALACSVCGVAPGEECRSDQGHRMGSGIHAFGGRRPKGAK